MDNRGSMKSSKRSRSTANRPSETAAIAPSVPDVASGSDHGSQVPISQPASPTQTAVGQMAICLDPAGIIRQVNTGGAKWLGYQPEELVGHNISDWVTVEGQATLQQTLLRVLDQTDAVIKAEFCLLRRDRTIVLIKATLQTLQGLAEQSTVLLSGQLFAQPVETSANDQTPILPPSLKLLQTILNALPLAVFVKDGQNPHFGKFRFWNHSCERLFGLTADQVLGKTDYDLFSTEQAMAFSRQDRLAFADHAAEAVSEMLIDNYRLGERLLRTIKLPIYDEQHQPQYLLCLSEDITERRQVGDALRQQAEREGLVGAIAQQIRQFLDLRKVLATTVNEVRRFLQTDRVCIFRFDSHWSGHVLVESVASQWRSILGTTIADPCFDQALVDKYTEGHVRAIADIHTQGLPSCYVEMMTEFQVQSVLVVPILQAASLWGLLIVHHCSEAREWQPLEIDLLKQLAEQSGIAIQQSELYRQVQRLNADLERQVQTHAAQLQLAFEFEATLKRITDRVRDSLDEDQILQTAVQELAIALGVSSCNAALYNQEQHTSTVHYEYTTSLMPFQGRVVQMDNFWEGYSQLLEGQYFQFCSLLPNPVRGRVAMLACPLVDDQGVMGDLWLVNQSYQAFSEQDIRLVQQVANQCAIALRQASLYQAAQTQVKELEKLNRLKDDFLSTVSHELRTPMSNIKLATQMLEIALRRENLLEQKSSALTRYFQILRDECQREIHLIDNLLDLSRLEAGSETLTLSAIDLQDWLPQFATSFIERAHNQQQSLTINIPPRLPQLITDQSYLERILNELLNNACKYTPAHGQITVTVAPLSTTPLSTDFALPHSPTVRLSGHAEALAQSSTLPVSTLAPAIQIQVSNSGIEISPDELTRIFNKFYRIPNNDPWKHGGTGLGLALVRKLVQTMGGAIAASSEAGITNFSVELPGRTLEQ